MTILDADVPDVGWVQVANYCPDGTDPDTEVIVDVLVHYEHATALSFATPLALAEALRQPVAALKHLYGDGLRVRIEAEVSLI